MNARQAEAGNGLVLGFLRQALSRYWVRYLLPGSVSSACSIHVTAALSGALRIICMSAFMDIRSAVWASVPLNATPESTSGTASPRPASAKDALATAAVIETHGPHILRS